MSRLVCYWCGREWIVPSFGFIERDEDFYFCPDCLRELKQAGYNEDGKQHGKHQKRSGCSAGKCRED